MMRRPPATVPLAIALVLVLSVASLHAAYILASRGFADNGRRGGRAAPRVLTARQSGYRFLVPAPSTEGLGHVIGAYNRALKMALHYNLTLVHVPHTGMRHGIGSGVERMFDLGRGVHGDASRTALAALLRDRRQRYAFVVLPEREPALGDAIRGAVRHSGRRVRRPPRRSHIVFEMPSDMRDCEYEHTAAWFRERYLSPTSAAAARDARRDAVVRIGVHVRRGDQLPRPRADARGRGVYSKIARERNLPDAWYASILQQVLDTMHEQWRQLRHRSSRRPLTRQIQVHVYSEGVDGRHVDADGRPSSLERHMRAFHAAAPTSETTTTTTKPTTTSLPWPHFNVSFYYHAALPFDVTFHHLVDRSDVLVTSRGEFSHLAAVLSRAPVKVAVPHSWSYFGTPGVVLTARPSSDDAATVKDALSGSKAWQAQMRRIPVDDDVGRGSVWERERLARALRELLRDGS